MAAWPAGTVAAKFFVQVGDGELKEVAEAIIPIEFRGDIWGHIGSIEIDRGSVNRGIAHALREGADELVQGLPVST